MRGFPRAGGTGFGIAATEEAMMAGKLRRRPHCAILPPGGRSDARWVLQGVAFQFLRVRIAPLPFRPIPVFLISFLLLASFATQAHADPPSQRIAIVMSREIGPYREAVDGFRKQIESSMPGAAISMHDLGGEASRGESIAAAISAASCDLVHVVGTEAYKAIAPHILETPIVISMVYDPEVEFLLDPVKNPTVYGASLRVPLSEQLVILERFCPHLRRISVVYGESSAVTRSELDAASPRIEVVGIPIVDLNELERALERARSAADGFLMILDENIYTKTTTQNVLLFFMRAKIPVFSFSPNYAKAGALLSISSRYDDNGATAARLAAEILRGHSVPDRFPPTNQLRLDWNERAAEALGIELSSKNRAACTEIYGS